MTGAAFQLAGPGQVELIHVADETWISAPPALVGAAVAVPGVWARFWPDLAATLAVARGELGVRLSVGNAEWHGSAELYVHAALDGAVLFHFLRLDPVAGRRISRRAAHRERERRSRCGRAAAWAVKDDVEGRTQTGGRAARR